MQRFKVMMKLLLGVLFIAAGAYHFANAQLYVSIMPPYLPWHLELVYLSGVLEVALGALLLVPGFSAPAAWGLIALLFAVFPANIHMAVHSDQFPSVTPALLWARLPLQGVLIAWAYWTGIAVSRKLQKGKR